MFKEVALIAMPSLKQLLMEAGKGNGSITSEDASKANHSLMVALNVPG
jgi:hypothetical protein